MLTQKWIFTDEQGVDHICQKAGRQPQIICVDGTGTPEENMIFALRQLSCDPEVMLGNTIKKCSSGEEVFTVHTGGAEGHLYFVKMIERNKFEIILNRAPFWYGDSKSNVKAVQYKDITLFCYTSTISDERISPYYYLQW